jgi:hypothetical protein
MDSRAECKHNKQLIKSHLTVAGLHKRLFNCYQATALQTKGKTARLLEGLDR